MIYEEIFVFFFHSENSFPPDYKGKTCLFLKNEKKNMGTYLLNYIGNYQNFRRCERHSRKKEIFPISLNINLLLADPWA